MINTTFGHKLILIIFVFIFTVCCFVKSVLGLSPEKSLNQYVHNKWGIEDGLPQISVVDIVQTKDGYIWFATEEGLVKFDGVKFKVYDSSNVSEIKNNMIWDLNEDKNQNLWISTLGGGLVKHKNGKFTLYNTDDGLNSNTIGITFEDTDGNIWIGTYNGINIYKNGKFKNISYERHLHNNRIITFYQHTDNSIWIGTNKGLLVYKNGKIETNTKEDDLLNEAILSFYRNSKGNIWIGARSGLFSYENNKFKSLKNKYGIKGFINSFLLDKNENLWIASSNGLYRIKNEKTEHFSKNDGLTDNSIYSLLEDKEGNLWVGTRGGGLNQFYDGVFTTFTSKHGLTGDQVTTIYQNNNDEFWFGTVLDGISKFKENKFYSFNNDELLPDKHIGSILFDSKNNLWIGTTNGLVLIKDNELKSTIYTNNNELSNNYITVIFEDYNNNIWIGTDNGLLSFNNNKFTIVDQNKDISLKKITGITEDKKRNIWISTYGQGLFRYKNGDFTVFDQIKGLNSKNITSLYTDKDDNIWISTAGDGLFLYKKNKFYNFTTNDGLFNNTIWAIVEDNFGSLWISCNKGIFKTSKQNLFDFSKGLTKTLDSISFGTTDGMKSRECIGIGVPAGFKSNDGRIWFPTVKGVVVTDPSKILKSETTPPLYIESMFADQQLIPIKNNIVLNPETENIEFHYTALRYSNPNKVEFKYMIEGFEKKWINVKTRRVAYYTNLPHGNYKFKVKACINNEKCNNEAASINFKIKPFYYETNWFYFLCYTTVFLLGLGIYFIKLRCTRKI